MKELKLEELENVCGGFTKTNSTSKGLTFGGTTLLWYDPTDYGTGEDKRKPGDPGDPNNPDEPEDATR